MRVVMKDMYRPKERYSKLPVRNDPHVKYQKVAEGRDPRFLSSEQNRVIIFYA
jgi:hypothetical protein